MGADEALESELGLGELAGLTVANEADSLAYDVSSCILYVITVLIEKDGGGKNFFTGVGLGLVLISDFAKTDVKMS